MAVFVVKDEAEVEEEVDLNQTIGSEEQRRRRIARYTMKMIISILVAFGMNHEDAFQFFILG